MYKRFGLGAVNGYAIQFQQKQTDIRFRLLTFLERKLSRDRRKRNPLLLVVHR